MARPARPAADSRRRARLLRALTAAAVLALSAVGPPRCAGQVASDDKRPLFEREPYDEIHLREGAVVKVELLPLEGRKVPENPSLTDKLIVKRLGETDEYEVLWRNIEKLRLWEQILLDEANRLVAAERFNEAYAYFAYLRRPPYPDRLPALDESLQGYYFAEARYSHRKGRYDQALALLYELYALNPQYAGLEAEMAAAVDALIAQYLDRDDYDAARKLLAGLQSRFPQNAIAGRRRAELTAEARQLLAAAREHFEAGRLHDAREAAFASVRIWPLEDAARLLSEAQRVAPRVVVGVTVPLTDFGPARLERPDDWAARRSGRLVHRTLLEFTGHGPTGGQYRCPLGELERINLGRTLVLHLNPNVRWSDGARLTAAEVSRHVLAMAQEGHFAYRPDWDDLLAGVSARNVFEVQIDLARGHVHPDALLQTALIPWNRIDPEQDEIPSTGPYRFPDVVGNELRYRANEYYLGAGSKQPQEIVERFYADGRSAASALRRGEITLLDRVNPWDVEPLQADEQIEVRPYAVPTVHCLIPNPDRPWMQVGLLRRAVTYGINRDAILEQLLRGDESPDNRVISGPFPAGARSSDPRGYAYDDEIAPRRYDPRLALTLGSLALRQQAEAAKKRGDEPPEGLPTLVLAHPPDDLARVACRAIKRQLALVGVPVALEEFSSEPFAEPQEYDLRYAELAVWEPIVDARRLFGPEGITGNRDDYLRLALRQLEEQASDWAEARDKLREIHRIVHDDVSLVPLWQLTDHYAYHRSLQGVGERLVTLYQNVEQWQSPPAVVPELARRPAAGEGSP